MTLGLLVTGVTYRHPGLLAKTVATLDVLSGGRGELGIGAAWYDREHRGLGVPFPPTAERFERLEETLQICFQMWSDNNGPFKSKHYELAETLCSPPPISRPRPPVMIGGSGERKTLRLVAQYANSCNLFELGLEEIEHKLDVLHRHATTSDTTRRDHEDDADPRRRSPTPMRSSTTSATTPSSVSTPRSRAPRRRWVHGASAQRRAHPRPQRLKPGRSRLPGVDVVLAK
jgi:alkanesulfonate monooxygenase SsuD/methylene tetrahydromethanopterin reductase-like flavin-dependent oxidoreductase (luciferase family)